MPEHLIRTTPLAALVVVLCVAAFVLRRLWLGAAQESGLRPAAVLGQMVCLAVVMLVVFGCLSGAAVGLDWRALGNYDFAVLKQSVAWGAFVSGLLLVPLIIGFLIRSSVTAIILSMSWVVVFGFGLYAWNAFPTVNAIRDADAVGLYDSSLLLSVWFMPLRLWMWSAATLICGFIFVRRRFSTMRLLVSTVIAGYVIGLICMPVAVTPELWPAPFALAALAWLLARLPFSRSVLAKHFGVRFEPEADVSRRANSRLARILAGACALFFIAAIVFSAVVNYHERIQVETVKSGRIYQGDRPAGTNAYDILKERFLKETRPTIATAGQPKDYALILQLIEPTTSASRTKIIAEMDHAEWDAYMGRIEPYLSDLEGASEADYLLMPAGSILSYLNLREAGRALSIRSQLAWHDGRGEDAVKDMNVIFNIARLMGDRPTLVEQMIGNALKNLGTKTAENLVWGGDGGPEMLNRLSVALEKVAPTMERGLDYDALKVGRAGILSGAIIPNIEPVVPAVGRAHRDALDGWDYFKRVRLGAAEVASEGESESEGVSEGVSEGSL